MREYGSGASGAVKVRSKSDIHDDPGGPVDDGLGVFSKGQTDTDGLLEGGVPIRGRAGGSSVSRFGTDKHEDPALGMGRDAGDRYSMATQPRNKQPPKGDGPYVQSPSGPQHAVTMNLRKGSKDVH